MENILVVKDTTLSKENDPRYVIIDKTTNEIIDNAQGYGYKSREKAYAAYAYKHRDKSKDKERKAKEFKIKKWMKEHKDFVIAMNDYCFEIAKGSWGKDAKFDTKLIKQMLKDNNLETDFKPAELLRVWKKKNTFINDI